MNQRDDSQSMGGQQGMDRQQGQQGGQDRDSPQGMDRQQNQQDRQQREDDDRGMSDTHPAGGQAGSTGMGQQDRSGDQNR